MNVLIVPDKFKGTLTAQAAAGLIAQGWLRARPEDRLSLLPMSDGGDGFGEVLANLSKAEFHSTRTTDAAGQPHDANWWWDASAGTAIIESAGIIGLALLPPGKFHPFNLDTSGLGIVLQKAAAHGARKFLIGIGGSATNDGGFGVARSLGWRFLQEDGSQIVAWTELHRLSRVVRPESSQPDGEFVVAVDVQNPLLGPTGASRIYGPQKGLRPEDFPIAEAALGRLAVITERDLGMPGAAQEPGTGAAGGLGFGLRCFLDAKLESGFAIFSRIAKLRGQIRQSDLVLTAEGAIDPSTLMGKGVGEVAAMCRAEDVPCIGLAGTLALAGAGEASAQLFQHTYGIVPQLTDPADARANPSRWLPELACMAASNLSRSTVTH